MNEEAFIISLRRDPALSRLLKKENNKALMAHAKRVAPWLNMETLARYRRKYEHSHTPTETKWANKIVTFPFES